MLTHSASNAADTHAREQVPELTRLREMFDIVPSGLVLIDGDGVVTEANRQARQMLSEPLLGQPWVTIIARAFRPQVDDGHEVSLWDGRRVKILITPLHYAPGQLIQITDLTETRQLQQRLAHMQRLSSLGKMVASLAHQIRTPLSAAMLYGANLANPLLNAAMRQKFQGKLMGRLQALEKQVDDMLLFAKGGELSKVEPVLAGELLTRVRQAMEPQLQQRGGQLQLKGDALHLSLMANAEMLCSALCNLVNNSLEAAGGTASVVLSAEQSSDDLLELRVCDAGPGIPRDILARVSEPFFTTKSQGTGLGLAVVQAVTRAHQGRFEIHSETGRGTQVTLTFPLCHQPSESLADAVGAW